MMYLNDYVDLFLKDDVIYKKITRNHKITNFTDDSKKCMTSSVFFAIKGITNNGHNLIDNAIKIGTKTIVCEDLPKILLSNINYIKVKSSKKAYHLILLHLVKDKLKKMKIIGITGTNGKTTVSTLTYEMLKYLNFSVMQVGTNGTFVYQSKIKKETKIDTPNTTPKLSIILEIIKKFSQIDYLIMEVSSEALDSNRIDEIKFDTVVFTNLGHDHLNSHHYFKDYLKAKLKLFSLTKPIANAIINIEDKNAHFFLKKAEELQLKVKTFGLFNGELEGEILSINKDYMMIKIYSSNYEYIIGTNLLGKFNLLNILTSLCILESEKISINKVLSFFEKPLYIIGRYEKYYLHNRNVYIDYAHNPEAIKEFLTTLNKLKENKKIITVIGAGGNKDEKKRPKMGEYASLLSDLIIFTEDNSRDEDVKLIIDGLISGTKRKNYLIEYNREIAIKKAFLNSSTNDYIVLLGMGTDKYRNNKTDLQMAKEVKIIE